MDETYKFHIEGSYSPETFPMEHLGEYLCAYGKLLGEKSAVHLGDIKAGSTVLVARVDQSARQTVKDRMIAIQTGQATAELQNSYRSLDDLLRRDGAVGVLRDDLNTNIIEFPGRNRPQPKIYEPITQIGSIDGEIYRIGGKDATVPVALRSGDVTYTHIETTVALARELSRFLYNGTVRLHGTGTWVRTGEGTWDLRKFKVSHYEVLDEAPLQDVLHEIRNLTKARPDHRNTDHQAAFIFRNSGGSH